METFTWLFDQGGEDIQHQTMDDLSDFWGTQRIGDNEVLESGNRIATHPLGKFILRHTFNIQLNDGTRITESVDLDC